MERRVRQQHVLQETSDNVQQLRFGRFEFRALNQSNGSERVRMRLRVQIQIVIVAAGATESTLLQAGLRMVAWHYTKSKERALLLF